MAEDQAKMKKLEKAVKKLKSELDSQKADLQAQLQDKSALVESLKAKVEASGGEEGGDDKAGAALQEVIDEQKEQIVEKDEYGKKLEVKLKTIEAGTKDKLETQKNKLEADFAKQLEEAGGGGKPAEKKGSSEDVPADYIPGGVEPWMATFADMVTLLMVFFVLFYSVEKDNVGKFKAAIEQQVADEGASAPGLAQMLKVMDEVKIQKTLRELMDKKKEDFKETPPKKIILRVPGLSIFKPGGARSGN